MLPATPVGQGLLQVGNVSPERARHTCKVTPWIDGRVESGSQAGNSGPCLLSIKLIQQEEVLGATDVGSGVDSQIPGSVLHGHRQSNVTGALPEVAQGTVAAPDHWPLPGQ